MGTWLIAVEPGREYVVDGVGPGHGYVVDCCRARSWVRG